MNRLCRRLISFSCFEVDSYAYISPLPDHCEKKGIAIKSRTRRSMPFVANKSFHPVCF